MEKKPGGSRTKAKKATPPSFDCSPDGSYPPEALQLALKILQSIRAREPQTLSDLPVKTYSEDDIGAMVERCCSSLGEHVDTVQIFVTRHDRGRTTAYTSGVGNEFARSAQIQSWLDSILGAPPEDPFDEASLQ